MGTRVPVMLRGASKQAKEEKGLKIIQGVPKLKGRAKNNFLFRGHSI